MAKIGRNEPCPCGSGMKFKKCCIDIVHKIGNTPTRQQISIAEEVSNFQSQARNMKEYIKIVGYFILFSTSCGDAWLLEAIENEALQIAKGGRGIQVKILETPEEIKIKWSHQFQIKGLTIETKSYTDGHVSLQNNYPVGEIKSSIENIKKKHSLYLGDYSG